jgi:hypothetical protein
MSQKKRKDLKKVLLQFYHRPATQVSLELFLTVFTILFFAVFAIRPTLLTMADLVNEINDKEELDDQLQRKVTALSSAQEEYQRLEGKIDLLDQAIPSQPLLLDSLKIVEKLAAESDVIIDSLRVSEVPAETIFQTSNPAQLSRVDVYFTTRVIGSYPAIRDYIEKLHQSRRTFIAEDITFLIDDDATQQVLKASLSIRVPYFGEQIVGKKNAK